MVVDRADDIGVMEDLKMRLRALDLRISGLQGMLNGLESKTDDISARKRVVLESTLGGLTTERAKVEGEYIEVGGAVTSKEEAPKAAEPEPTLRERFEAEEDDRQDHQMMRRAIKMRMESNKAAKDLMGAIRNGDFDQP
jgi:hypothetical protein